MRQGKIAKFASKIRDGFWFSGLLFFLSISVIGACNVFAAEQTPKQNYEKKYLLDLKVLDSDHAQIYIDGNENYFVLHYFHANLIEVFGKDGKLIRKFNWANPNPNGNYRICVDENGNILIYSPNGTFEKSILLDKDGHEIATFKVPQMPPEIGFSNGNVYSENDGVSLFKLLDFGKRGPGGLLGR